MPNNAEYWERKLRIIKIRDCECDAFHCMCDELFALEQHWWTAWTLMWVAIGAQKMRWFWDGYYSDTESRGIPHGPLNEDFCKMRGL